MLLLTVTEHRSRPRLTVAADISTDTDIVSRIRLQSPLVVVVEDRTGQDPF